MLLTLSAQPASAAVSVTLDGSPLAFETAPIIENGRVIVPMRGILQPLGYAVQWQEETQTVLAEKEGVSITLPLGKNTATVNGEAVSLDAPARILNGRTFVPLRFLAEYSGANVAWDGGTESVSIRSSAEKQAGSMQDSVVYIQTNKMQGSGVILSADGLIATNFHVLENISTAQFVFQDGSIYQGSATVVGLSPEDDIALVKIEKAGLSPAVPATLTQAGETVYAVGSPNGKRNTITAGTVEGFSEDIISATAVIAQGSSGGGLFNASGGLVGITSFFTDGQYFSIPIAKVMQLPQTLSIPLGNMREYEYTPHAPENLRCVLDEEGYANISWAPVYGADYYIVSVSASPDGPFRPLQNKTLGNEQWYWGFPQCFGISSSQGQPIYMRVAAVVGGKATAESETIKAA